MVHERSGGRIKLKIISRMFPGTDILEAVTTGKADMGDVPMPYHSATYPLWNWGEIPGIVDEDHLTGFGEEQAIYQDPRVLKIYDETMGKLGLKFWFVTQWEPGVAIWSKKKIDSLADLKGMKIRVYGYLPTLAVKSLGASPVTIASGELAPAMMAGTVDAALSAVSFGYSMGLTKTAKYVTLVPTASTWSAVTVINAKKFNSLPPDLQKVLTDVGRELQQMVMYSTTAEYIMSVDTVKLSGIEISKLQPDQRQIVLDKLKVVENEWLKLAGSQGNELLSAVKSSVDNYRSFSGK
jgi:TRAP-type C4-dicarboxylate transport system substrate-binding protein